MANPKYADLPGIASGQPDIYETSDLPESDQTSTEAYEDQSENVEKLSVSATEAFAKFKGRTLDASEVDFTDRIMKSRRSGYSVATSGEWEMLADESREKETPLQRYQRLQHETRELLEDLNKIKEETATENQQKQAENETELVYRMEQLQMHLTELNLQTALGSEMIANLTDPHGALQKKLINEIAGFRPKLEEQQIKNQPSPGQTERGQALKNVSEGDSITYELHYKPEYGQLGTVSKVADLEQRLKKMELVLGTDNSKMSLLTGYNNDKSILTAVEILSSKLNLLDPTSLDQIETRLGLLLQHLQQISEKKSKMADFEKENKIGELYELVKKTVSMGTGLNGVVERLQGLRELHEQALQFGKSLTQLDNVQQQIAASLKTDDNQLKTVQETLAKNFETIQKNVSSLDERINKLKK